MTTFVLDGRLHAPAPRPAGLASLGRHATSARSTAIARALERRDVRVCRFGVYRCDDLGGTTNVQGDSAGRAGADFVHLKLTLPLRADPAQRDRVVEAVLHGVTG